MRFLRTGGELFLKTGMPELVRGADLFQCVPGLGLFEEAHGVPGELASGGKPYAGHLKPKPGAERNGQQPGRHAQQYDDLGDSLKCRPAYQMSGEWRADYEGNQDQGRDNYTAEYSCVPVGSQS